MAQDSNAPLSMPDEPNHSREQSPCSLSQSSSANGLETGERSAREQLQKATLASIGSKAADTPSEGPIAIGQSIASQNEPEQHKTPGEDTRGRVLRKRSHDDLEEAADQPRSSFNGRADTMNDYPRKRSREKALDCDDVTTEQDPATIIVRANAEKEVIPEQGTQEASAADKAEDTGTQSATSTSADPEGGDSPSDRSNNGDGERITQSRSNLSNLEAVPDNLEGDASPRKKRSRDHLDTDTDREQKIAATEEARAQRLSTEVDRSEVGAFPRENVAPQEEKTEDGSRNATQPKSVFGSTSKVTNITKKPDDISQQRAPSKSAFAHSGFASVSGSGFGGFGSAQNSGSAFSAITAGSSPKPAWNQATPSGLSTTASETAPDASNKAAPSPFAGSSINKPGIFGGSVLSGGFSTGIGTGGKLTSFAAPNGDAKLGRDKRSIKPIGSPNQPDQDQGSSDSEAEDDNEAAKEVSKSDTDKRFHSQDVETGEDGEASLFSSKASLFSFRENAWKESGKGTFKFNVTDTSAEEGSAKNGRFIMRAHQTYRVLLNAPVFKQMKVGDIKGNEPTGKSFSFAVIEDGKPVPHLLKLGDASESKTLYHAVQKLQEDLD